jgi:hypothetical protein
MHAIRKGQYRWLAKGDVLGQRQFIHTLFWHRSVDLAGIRRPPLAVAAVFCNRSERKALQGSSIHYGHGILARVP